MQIYVHFISKIRGNPAESPLKSCIIQYQLLNCCALCIIAMTIEQDI